jgi:hypothetical protein
MVDKHVWKHPTKWRGRLPREIYNHKLLDSTRTGVSHRNIIRHRGYRLMMRERRFRLYLDLCERGVIFGLVKDENNGLSEESEVETHLPELFIWQMLKELLDACLVL